MWFRDKASLYTDIVPRPKDLANLWDSQEQEYEMSIGVAAPIRLLLAKLVHCCV
jgi:hypothetical protein